MDDYASNQRSALSTLKNCQMFASRTDICSVLPVNRLTILSAASLQEHILSSEVWDSTIPSLELKWIADKKAYIVPPLLELATL